MYSHPENIIGTRFNIALYVTLNNAYHLTVFLIRKCLLISLWIYFVVRRQYYMTAENRSMVSISVCIALNWIWAALMYAMYFYFRVRGL